VFYGNGIAQRQGNYMFWVFAQGNMHNSQALQPK